MKSFEDVREIIEMKSTFSPTSPTVSPEEREKEQFFRIYRSVSGYLNDTFLNSMEGLPI